MSPGDSGHSEIGQNSFGGKGARGTTHRKGNTVTIIRAETEIQQIVESCSRSSCRTSLEAHRVPC
jgi:hypothetical protein